MTLPIQKRDNGAAVSRNPVKFVTMSRKSGSVH